MSSNEPEQKKTLLDRSLILILDNSDATPSRRFGISASQERLHRLHGASLIRSACRMLQLSTSCFGTACTLFHRYLHAVSLSECNVWSLAMGCILVAAKTQEIVLTTKQVILVFSHLYRKRRLIYVSDCHAILQHEHFRRVAVVPPESRWSFGHKQTVVTQVQPISPLGPVFKEWLDELVRAENLILRQMGFTVHWIPTSHPHNYLDSLFQAIFLQAETCQSKTIQQEEIQQLAWNYCNDSFLLDLCVRYPPRVVACAAMYLACLDAISRGNGVRKASTGETNSESSPASPSWQSFLDWITIPDWSKRLCGGSPADVGTVANALLGLQDGNNVDIQVALFAFVSPVNTNDSFNGPHSFLWDFANDVAERMEAKFTNE